METEDLRKAGLKVTHPRTRILELLETGVRHMSAEDIYKRLINSGEEIGLATVYRVLQQFESAGLVLKHNFEGGQAVYGRAATPGALLHAGDRLELLRPLSADRLQRRRERAGRQG